MSLGGIVPHEDAIATAMRGSFAAATDLAGAAHNRTSDRGFLNSEGAHGGNRPFPP